MTCLCVKGMPGHCQACGCVNNPAGPTMNAMGEPCRNKVVDGTFKCHFHGGSSPQALRKAQEAAALLRMPALEAMYQVLDSMTLTLRGFQETTCPACGMPDLSPDSLHGITKVCAVILRQAQMVLDRTGLPPKAVLEVKQSDGDVDIRSLTVEERARMMELFEEMDRIKDRARQRQFGTPVPMTLAPAADDTTTTH